MIGIQSFMFLALGILLAGFFVLALLPFYRRRAERLTLDRVKRSMPLTEAEIRADKDRLRADYAILIHELEARVEDAGQSAARQRVELNRRDAAISAIEAENATMRTKLDEHENARRVLEQSIMDRLPKVEQRLAGAKKLLYERDREIITLTSSAEKQTRALDEATQINRQQREDIDRLSGTLSTRAARNRKGLDDPRFDGEVALKSEIEALRAKTREQASLIDRMQSETAKRSAGQRGVAALMRGGNAVTSGGTPPDADGDTAGELAILKQQLVQVQAALADATDGSATPPDREVRTLKAKTEDQATRIAELEGELGAFRAVEQDAKSLTDTKMAMKAELSRLEVQNTKQREMIEQLRAEVTGGQERLARQAAHFMGQMRRLGAGTLPVADSASGVATNVDMTALKTANEAAVRAAQTTAPSSVAEAKPSVFERISAPRDSVGARPDLMTALTRSGIAAPSATAPGADRPAPPKPPHTAIVHGDGAQTTKGAGTSEAPPSEQSGATPDASVRSTTENAAPAKRPGLLDRITKMDKSKVPSKTA